MSPRAPSRVALHNVAETAPAWWADGGRQLLRVPESVTAELNVDARERYRHPAGCELRFVPEGAAAVTLSAPDETAVRPFWGPFQASEPREIGPGKSTIELAVPERLRELRPGAAATSPFELRVCRLRFDPWIPVAVHGVEGEVRPPQSSEVPDRRYLAYGTSITEGAAASAGHLTYVARAARRAGLDPLNLGASGSAFCEPAVAEYVAGRGDWDVATLALSVNMANRGFTVAQFRERAANMVRTVAGADPDRPVLCVTLFPYHADACRGDNRERAAAFRDALREAVAACPHRNARLVEGESLLDATGLTADVLHPGDAGMEAIGRGLGAELTEAIG